MIESIALDKVAYCGEHLSENIVVTPEGYLICKNAVLARTGFQKYRVAELTDPDGLVKDRQASDEINVYRPADQVFAPVTIASFEGKTFTIRHPNDLLNPSTDGEHNVGHVSNVRQGEEPLDDGNMPLLGDIFVKGERAIDLILKRKLRELSCGYAYKLVKNGERFEQHHILGNHVALVDSARAGAEARIMDSAPTSEREVKPMTVKQRIFQLLGLGMKELAKTEDPVELAKAQTSMSQFATVMDSMSEEGKMSGKVEPPQSQLDAEAAAKKAEEEKKAADAKTKDDDFEKRMHDALSGLITKHREAKEAQDVDLTELGNLFKAYTQEEKGEPQHQADEEVKPIEEEKEKAKDAEKCAKCGKDMKECGCDKKAKDEDKDKAKDAEIVNPEPKLAPGQVPESQFDCALEVLKGLRPVIARSADKKVISAFNTALDAVNSARKKESTNPGSYAAFLAATRSKARDDKGVVIEPPKVGSALKQAKELDDLYKNLREAPGKKGK